ncbi:uncharacterized protein LOC141727159 isoform X2 [Zonotrichia albicollis]|uniref:uncharacterized protein LOC141727159 isoform X2 n=1 Tax=Zonotrichia albicollis TaxID=44394 RepID=UPI003D811799
MRRPGRGEEERHRAVLVAPITWSDPGYSENACRNSLLRALEVASPGLLLSTSANNMAPFLLARLLQDRSDLTAPLARLVLLKRGPCVSCPNMSRESLMCKKTKPQSGNFRDSSCPARLYPAVPPPRASFPVRALVTAPRCFFPHADLSNRPNAAQTPPSAPSGTSSSALRAMAVAPGAVRRRRWCSEGSFSPGERFRSHPVGMVVLILLFLVLALVLGAALAVLAAPQIPVTPASLPSVLGCPFDWVGYRGFCCYFSRDYGTWEQAQERCSKLNASLAIVKDEDSMELLFRLCGNVHFWLGLHRQGKHLQWVDNSSYSFRDRVHSDSECVYLADGRLMTGNCANERLYICSKAQAPL